MSQTPSKSPPSVGQRLLAALTEDQVQILLTNVAEAGLLAGLDEKLRAADPDLADTVRRFIADQPSTQAVATISDQKALETWNDFWGDWDSHISELGDAEGAYANQEEHWHPPYFDATALTDDLEKDAGRLLEWLERAFPLVKQPDVFRASLAEIDAGIRSYPDWMQPFEDCCALGPLATTCVLRWTWLGLADEPSPGPRLADAIHSFEDELEQVALDTDACVRFISQSPDAVARKILAHLRGDDYAEALADIRSVWHRVRHEYEKRIDPTAYLRTCAEHLGGDWRYGEPLIADSLTREDLAEAERFVEVTLSSLLRADPEEPWRPELGLLPESPYCRFPEESEAIPRLLAQWEAIATKRGRTKRAAACRLQRALHEHPHDWPLVLEDFAAFHRDGGAPAVAGELFAQWRERAVAACAHYDTPKQKPEDTWVYSLVEARRDPASHQARFLEHTRAWLDCCLESAAFFGKHWHALALLTRALPQAATVKDQWPTFNLHVLMPATGLEPKLLASLSEALAFLGDVTARLDPLPIWREHLHTLVPSPGAAGGSCYREPARWMKALSEINAASYGKVLARWKTEFKRRRNLWAEMASVHCPGL
ncbi:MAG: hypothetical protein HYY24_22760 [Verrucomicrobia bacterium]|nr:hypothetical protein [Verrucomicrobiota bacterium]